MTQYSSTRLEFCQASTRLWLLVVLCLSLLIGVSAAQACHVHEGLRSDGKAQLSAPLDTCPLCAVPHASMPGVERAAVAGIPPREQQVAAIPLARGRSAMWSFDLFSRPPPASFRSHEMAGSFAERRLM